MTNGVALGLVLWASPLRLRGRGGKTAAAIAVLVIPVIVAFTMPTFKTALLVLLGDGVGMAVATPVILALAYVLLRKKEPNSPSSE
jgi:integral membrane sensor domain MASE1